MLEFDERLVALAIAIVIDAMLGDPGWLWSRIPHPVVWAGRVISALDAPLNRPADTARQRRLIGLVTVVVLCLFVAAMGWALSALLATS
ncbi:MAG: cobalamin biosynthesis protein, partial [Hyphomicrobiaceae bacterium]